MLHCGRLRKSSRFMGLVRLKWNKAKSKIHHFMKTSYSVASVIAAIALQSASAAILIHETFDYSTGAIGGQAANATGLSGNWSAGGTLSSGSNATFNIAASSLNFTGHFAAEGGSLLMSNGGGNYGEGAATATVGATLTGSSALFSSSIMTLNISGSYFNDWVIEQRFNSVADGNFNTTSGRNLVSSFGSGSSSNRKGGVSSNNSEVTQATGTLSAGTKYLLVTSYVVSGSDITNATMHAFNESAYASYLANTSVETAAADLGTYALFSLSDTDTASLANFDFLQFSILGGPTGQVDDFRVGTQITDVVNVIPEPSAAVLGLLGALGILRRRRP